MEEETKINEDIQIEESVDIDDFGKPTEVNDDASPDDSKKAEPQTTTDAPPLKGYMEKLGYEIPEDIDFSNEEEAINKIKEHNKPEDTDDDFIKEYKEKKSSEGFDKEAFLKEKAESAAMKRLPADEGLRKYLSSMQEDGERVYTDDDIDEFLSGKSKIEKDSMWKTVKEQIKEPEPESKAPSYEEHVKDYNSTVVEKLLTNATSDLTTAKDIYGIPYGEADKTKFNKEFTELMSIDAKGEPIQVYPKPVLKILNNPQELYKLLYVHSKLKSGDFDLVIKDRKNEVSEEALSKMGVSRKNVSGEFKATAAPPTPDDFT